MSTRKLIKGDRYRAGLWKLEERCYEAHVRMPNAKFMIRTYRCTQGEAVAKFDSWVEAEGLDLAEDGAREACEGSIDDGMGTARRPLNREERRAMERRDRKIKKRQARKAASEADAARQSQDMGKEETEMQKVSKTDGQKTAAAATKAPETEPARCYTLMCTGDLGTAPVMVYRPGIDLSGEESLSACTLFTRHRIERYAAGGRDGFINVLMQGLGRGIDARPGDVAGIGDVLWLRSRVESERQGERIERLRSRAKAAAEPVADIDGLRAENARLRADAEAWEEIATDQERSYSDATAKVDKLTRTVQRLEGEKRALERKAVQCAAPSDDDGAARVAECLQSIPRDLTDLLKLARSIWPERIVVLPEAMDSAKSYDGNLAEEWDIVRSTATALYGLLFEDDGCEGQVADEFQRRTGYELAFSESSATRARADLMKMRERSYGGRTVDISAHIKGRSQKNTFRLHFYIDRENELIVIGHAGCHMKTAGSHRRGFK